MSHHYTALNLQNNKKCLKEEHVNQIHNDLLFITTSLTSVQDQRKPAREGKITLPSSSHARKAFLTISQLSSKLFQFCIWLLTLLSLHKHEWPECCVRGGKKNNLSINFTRSISFPAQRALGAFICCFKLSCSVIIQKTNSLPYTICDKYPRESFSESTRAERG